MNTDDSDEYHNHWKTRLQNSEYFAEARPSFERVKVIAAILAAEDLDSYLDDPTPCPPDWLFVLSLDGQHETIYGTIDTMALAHAFAYLSDSEFNTDNPDQDERFRRTGTLFECLVELLSIDASKEITRLNFEAREKQREFVAAVIGRCHDLYADEHQAVDAMVTAWRTGVVASVQES